MKAKEKNSVQVEQELYLRYPALDGCKGDIHHAYLALKTCFETGHKLLLAGNGGSAADADHIVGELMKSFVFSRPIEKEIENRLLQEYGDEAKSLIDHLEGALPAISLGSMPAINTAFANDVDASLAFAQMTYGYGRKGDLFWGISTSGNSKNIVHALMMAKACGMGTILLTGGSGGKCAQIADITICVPEHETFKIQELHLPIYHALCAMLEADMFEGKVVGE